MSRSRLFFAVAAFLLFVSGFVLVSPSLMLVDIVHPLRIDSTYLAFRQLEITQNSVEDTVYYNPADIGLNYSSIRITTSDSLQLEGWYVPASDSPAHTILLIHELNQSKLQYFDQLKQLHDRGLNIFIYDQRAHGSSEGNEFSIGKSAVNDIIECLHQLSQIRGTNMIILQGVGLGANLAMQAAIEDTLCKGLILENPVVNINKFLSRYSYYKWGIMRPIWSPVLKRKVEELAEVDLEKMKMNERILETTVPVLLLAGSEDSVSYISETLQIYQESSSSKKELLMIQGAGHLNMAQIGGEKYYNKIASFINVSFPKKKSSRYKKLAEIVKKMKGEE